MSEINAPLPKEILDVGHLIGLKTGTDQEDPEQCIAEWIPKKDTVEDFRYKTYSLYETIERNASRRKRKSLNHKQRKALFDLKKASFDFKKFEKINELWHSYFDSVLSEVKTKVDELKLARIDFHGAFILVSSSRNVSVVGLKGYVLQESKNTFKILNPENRLLEIPKCGTVFAFEHKDKIYRINGYNIMMSSFNRSKVKPKFNYVTDL